MNLILDCKIWILTCLVWTCGWSFNQFVEDDYDYQLDYHRPRDRQIALQLQAKAVENQGTLGQRSLNISVDPLERIDRGVKGTYLAGHTCNVYVYYF